MTALLRPDGRERLVVAGFSALLLLQGFTQFFAIPIDGGSSVGRMLLDAGPLAFAVICIGVLTRYRGIQVALLATMLLLVGSTVYAAQCCCTSTSRRWSLSPIG